MPFSILTVKFCTNPIQGELTFVTVMKSEPKKTPDTPSIRNRFLQPEVTNTTQYNRYHFNEHIYYDRRQNNKYKENTTN